MIKLAVPETRILFEVSWHCIAYWVYRNHFPVCILHKLYDLFEQYHVQGLHAHPAEMGFMHNSAHDKTNHLLSGNRELWLQKYCHWNRVPLSSVFTYSYPLFLMIW